MKTRTLLLMSVGTALLILIAGSVLLFQLSGQDQTAAPSEVGALVEVGDLDITVESGTQGGTIFAVDVIISGVADDLSGISLVTGDRRLEPLLADAEGRCTEITVVEQRCSIEFDTSAAESSNRTLLVVRGDTQRNWKLSN